MPKTTKQTPMMEQYFKIKNQYQDAFLFYRLGDFYELFHEDAINAAKILEITLTSRNKNAENPIPMCGVPHHSANDYIKRLIEEGYKVAVCEQMEDPKQAKGMVKREVVRVITPGTIMQDDAIPVKENNYIASILIKQGHFYLSYLDITTGDIYTTETQNEMQFINELQAVHPAEIVVQEDIDSDYYNYLKERLTSYLTTFSESKASQFKWELSNPSSQQSEVLNLLFNYLESIHIREFDHIKPVETYELNEFMLMNHYAKSQLELFRSLRTQRKKGSLLSLIDQTKTAMGGRLLNQWLDKPLLNMFDLSDRHQKVEQLMNHYFERMDLIDALDKVYDLERLVTKISMNQVNARDIDQLRTSLKQIPRINHILNDINQGSDAMNDLSFETLNEFSELAAVVDAVLVEEPPISITEGNIIKSGYNQQLDKYRDALENGQTWLAELQKKEREITGLKTLKVGYNKVFGYYIEISRLQAQNLNDDRYIRKQTLTNSERYFTDELKEIETTILSAQDKSMALEYELFNQLREIVNQYTNELQKLARQIASLDVLSNFASLSEKENYVRADLTKEARNVELIESRHPVVENIIGKANFVSNDLYADSKESLLLLTGPNMSGKSTYMRQIAYCFILNQIGCFVPAKYAKLPVIDQIFTRIGSSDDITSGQSTFMVEMMETNIALEQATENSLLLFDEIGRGTATFDGMALAEAIIKHIADKVRALTIFSTHFHELTDLEETIPSLKNIHVGAQEHNGNLVFLHKVMTGPADKSYGIHVAKLAGLPEEVIHDGQEILAELEENAKRLRENMGTQLNLFNLPSETKEDDIKEQEIVDTLRQININELTPLDAMQWLNQLIHKAKE